MRIKIKAIAATLALLIAVCAANSTAFADWYDDVKSGCTWVEIEGDNFVVDTFCGVEARYNESDYYYQCNELIMRFYKEAYNLNVLAYMNTGLVMLTDGYGFVEAETPKKGDIIYVTAAMRNSGSDHWAIVKDYSDGYITMFEQNVIWEGKAALNRQIKYPSESYYLLTPVSLGLAPDPVLKGAEKEEPVETTTEEPETTLPSTTKEVTTTAKPTTTKKVTTTVKPTTTKKVTTTKPTTTKPTATKPTTTKPTTTVPVTTTAVSVTHEETTTAWYYTYSYTEAESTFSPVGSSEYTEADSEKENKATLPLAIVCGVFAVGVATLAVILIKKKK